jgi:hypothetical protein
MMSVITKPAFLQPAIETSCGLFDWFDPIELGIRDRVLKRGKTPLLTTDQARVPPRQHRHLDRRRPGAWWYGNRVDESLLRRDRPGHGPRPKPRPAVSEPAHWGEPAAAATCSARPPVTHMRHHAALTLDGSDNPALRI